MSWKKTFDDQYGEFKLCYRVSSKDRYRLIHFIETEIIEKLIEDVCSDLTLGGGRIMTHDDISDLRAKWLGKETNA